MRILKSMTRKQFLWINLKETYDERIKLGLVACMAAPSSVEYMAVTMIKILVMKVN